MKTFFVILFLAVVAPAVAQITASSYSTATVDIPADRYTVNFAIHWTCADFPQTSAPGRVELVNGLNQVVGWAEGHVTQSGASGQASLGSVEVLGSSLTILSPNLEVADGTFTGVWHIAGVAPGTYTLRFWDIEMQPGWVPSATVWTHTWFQGGSAPALPNAAPVIAWTSAPASAEHGQAYTVTAHGHDDDGNLAQVNVWKNGQPFAFAGGGDGTDGSSGNPTSDAGPQTVIFTAQAVDATGATSPVITHVVTVNAPVNSPPTVTLLSPAAQTVTAGTTLTISARATDPDGNLVGHNLDIQRPAGDLNYQGGFAVGEPYAGGPVGSAGDSTRTAGFTFSDVGTYYVRSAANDGSGWYHSATVAVTVVAPPPAQYTLVTVAGAGGAVSPGGTFTAGSTLVIWATPDALHDFAGWSGDAGGSANPLAVFMDRDKTVQANFALKSFTLTTSAAGGGSVTPGGAYPVGSMVIIIASSDATHYFTGWSGDASGGKSSITVLVDRAKFVQAQFAPKAAQSISFAGPGNQSVGASFPLVATSSAGLPVSFMVLNGPAAFDQGSLTVTGPGSITVQAEQAGDAFTLPAAPVAVTFNASAPVVLKYQSAARTLLHDGRSPATTNYVLGNP